MENSKQRLATLTAELEKLNSVSCSFSWISISFSCGLWLRVAYSLLFTHSQQETKSLSPLQHGPTVWTQQRDIYGHQFHLKHYTIPKSCHQCHDVLWGSQKSGYECSGMTFSTFYAFSRSLS
jgi:hypothetical protein